MIKIEASILSLLGILFFATLASANTSQGWLGISMEAVTESIAQQYGLEETEGILVVAVFKNSPAEKGGLKEGDIILKFAGKKMIDVESLQDIIEDQANTKVDFDIVRDKKNMKLEVVIGARTAQKSYITVRAYEEEQAGDALEKVGKQREALQHYVQAINQYNSYDVDFRLREKTIKVVQQLTVPPTIPEEAERAVVLANAAVSEVTPDGTAYDKAIQRFTEASLIAPWYPVPYYNIARLSEIRGYAEYAIHNYKLYLLASPYADDAKDVRDKVYVLEDKLKEIKAQEKASADSLRKIEEEKEKYRRVICFVIGKNSMGPGTFHWWYEGYFDVLYPDIEWKSGLLLALGFEPMYYFFNPHGNSIVLSMKMFLGYENNKNSATLQLPENSFTMNTMMVSDDFCLGYRFLMGSVSIVPYAGLTWLRGDFYVLGGTVLNDQSLWVDKFRIGLPVLGAKIHMNTFFLQIQSASYFKPLFAITSTGEFYDKETQTIIGYGTYDAGSASNLTFSLGFTF